MTPEEMKLGAMKRHQLLMKEYAAIRHTLTKREQYFFDKTITILEEIAEEDEPSERTIVLSTGLMAGLCAAKMTQREYVTMAIGLGTAVIKAKLAGDMERTLHGRGNRD